MRRREVIALLGGAAVWPIAAARAQQAMPMVGISARRRPVQVARSWMHSAAVSPKPAMSKARTRRSNIAWRADNWIDCQHWRPIWSAFGRV